MMIINQRDWREKSLRMQLTTSRFDIGIAPSIELLLAEEMLEVPQSPVPSTPWSSQRSVDYLSELK